jgi:hypothetical protein
VQLSSQAFTKSPASDKPDSGDDDQPQHGIQPERKNAAIIRAGSSRLTKIVNAPNTPLGGELPVSVACAKESHRLG